MDPYDATIDVRWRRPICLVSLTMLPLSLVGIACGGSSLPEALRDGREVYGDVCSTCHGNRGQGGVGPELSGVLETWPTCEQHQEWIALGSERWKDEHGLTYGATDKAITKVMPEHEGRLSAREIAAVAAFERVEYGGGDTDVVLADCGLTTP